MAYADDVLALSPYLYWKLNESSGAAVQDATANDRDGTATGTTFNVGSILPNSEGSAVTLDGTDDEIISDDTGSTTNVTMAIWLQVESTPSGDARVAGYENLGGIEHDKEIYFSSGMVPFFRSRNGGADAVTPSGPALSTNTTYFIVGRMNSTTAQVFVNGLPYSSVACSTSQNVAGHSRILGGTDSLHTDFINATLSDFAVWHSALTDQQIADLYVAGGGVIPSPRRIGVSNFINLDGSAPTAITPNASTADGDLLLFFHYSAITGTDETVTLPTGFSPIFPSDAHYLHSQNNGLVSVGYRIRQSGDTTFTASVTNHATGTSGETIIEWIETWRSDTGFDSDPIGEVSSLITVTATTSNFGPFDATPITTVPDGSLLFIVAGRHDDLTTIAQTVLSGDGLAWETSTVDEATQGADAAMFTQAGRNDSGSTINPAASYTITGHGASTSATGAGVFFVLNPTAEAGAPASLIWQPAASSLYSR